MKIVLLQGLLAPYRYPIFEQLSKTPGWQVEVWFMGRQVKNRIWNEKTLTDYHFKYRFLSGTTINFGSKDTYPIWFNFSIFKQLSRARPDVIIMMGWDSLTSFLVHLYAHLTHTPFILYSDSTPLELSWRRTVTLPLVSWHVRTSDQLIAGGSRSRTYLKSLEAEPHHIHVSYNTIDVEKYRQMTRRYRATAKETRATLGIDNDHQVLLYYGQLIQRKGVDLLINSYAKLKPNYPNTTLLLIGDGPDKKRLEKIVNDLDLKDVLILPNPGDEAIGRYYSIANLFILPSTEEVWGLVVNEAMASGIPVIVSDVAGCVPDLIKPGIQGYTFKSKSITDLTYKIEQIISNQKLQKKMAKAARSTIEQFSPRITVKQFREAVLSAHPKYVKKINFRSRATADLVSIIIPTHKDALSLAKTLHSLEHQINPPRFEIIVESDESGHGAYATRNRALARSRGEYFAFIDAGTIASPNWLRSGIDSLQDSDYVGGPINRSHNPKSWAEVFGAHREFAVSEFFKSSHFFPTTNLFVTRRVVEDVGGFDARLRSSGDREFGERVYLSKRYKQRYDPKVIVIHPYRQYPDLLIKQRRIARGNVDLHRYHSNRYTSSPYSSLLYILIPPVWLLNKSSYATLSIIDKIKIFAITYHLSVIHHLEVIRYGFLRGR